MVLDSDRYETIKKEVANFLEDWEIHKYPINPFYIFKKVGIPVKTYGELPDGERQAAFSRSEDAFTKFEGSLIPTVYYNEKKSYCRIRFSLFHELGHIVLWHSGCDEKKEEYEANFFAGYIIAPIPLVINNCSSLDIEFISNIFEISYSSAKVVHDHAVNRILCGKVCEEYEYRILDLCSIEEEMLMDERN